MITEFLKWYFNLQLGETLLFAFQTIVLMILVAIPIVAARVVYKLKIKPAFQELADEINRRKQVDEQEKPVRHHAALSE